MGAEDVSGKSLYQVAMSLMGWTPPDGIDVPK
jgi:hypothetical protein